MHSTLRKIQNQNIYIKCFLNTCTELFVYKLSYNNSTKIILYGNYRFFKEPWDVNYNAVVLET